MSRFPIHLRIEDATENNIHQHTQCTTLELTN